MQEKNPIPEPNRTVLGESRSTEQRVVLQPAARFVFHRIPDELGGRESGPREDIRRDYGIRDSRRTELQIDVVNFTTRKCSAVKGFAMSALPISVFSHNVLNRPGVHFLHKYPTKIEVPGLFSAALKQGSTRSAFRPSAQEQANKALQAHLVDIAIGCGQSYVGAARFIVTRVLVLESLNEFSHAYLAQRDTHALCDFSYRGEQIEINCKAESPPALLYTFDEILRMADT